MTLADLCAVLGAAGLPYAQVQWDQSDEKGPPALPYALLVPGTSADVMADGTNFQRVTPYTAEVYTRGRDMALEGRIETALQALRAARRRGARDHIHSDGARLLAGRKGGKA